MLKMCQCFSVMLSILDQNGEHGTDDRGVTVASRDPDFTLE